MSAKRETMEVGEPPTVMHRYRLPPQFCGLPSQAEVLATQLTIPTSEAAATLRLIGQPEVRLFLHESDRSEPEILSALSVVAAWRSDTGGTLRLREASDPESRLNDLLGRWQDEGIASFVEARSGTDLRRRYDAAIRRRAKRDPELAFEARLADLGRLLAKSRRGSIAAASLGELRSQATVDVPSPDAAGDTSYFRDLADEDQQTHSLARYGTFLGPFLPDEVWTLLCGTLTFLRETEERTGRCPLSDGVPSSNEMQHSANRALSGSDLREAVRAVSDLILAVIRFDATGWLRSQRTGLNADLAVDVASLEADTLCDAVVDLIMASLGDTSGPPRVR